MSEFEFSFFPLSEKCPVCNKKVVKHKNTLYDFAWSIPFIYYHSCNPHEHQLEKVVK